MKSSEGRVKEHEFPEETEEFPEETYLHHSAGWITGRLFISVFPYL